MGVLWDARLQQKITLFRWISEMDLSVGLLLRPITVLCEQKVMNL